MQNLRPPRQDSCLPVDPLAVTCEAGRGRSAYRMHKVGQAGGFLLLCCYFYFCLVSAPPVSPIVVMRVIEQECGPFSNDILRKSLKIFVAPRCDNEPRWVRNFNQIMLL